MNARDIFPRPLQYLIAVAEHGSFTRAAEALFVSQPTLSQQIKQLEESLKLPLLDRTGKQVRLTDAGETYIYHARRACAELEAGTRAIHEVQNLSRGSLRLGWTPITDYMTCSLLEQYNRHYPGIVLTTLEMPADDIELAVMEDRIDFGISFTRPSISDHHKSDITRRPLFADSLCLAFGNAHPWAGQTHTATVHDLDQEHMILLNQDFELRRKIDKYCHDHNINPNIAIETDSLSVIVEMVQVGKLVTILPQSIIHTQCGIHSATIDPDLPKQEISIISRNKGYRNPASLAFAVLAAEWSDNRLKTTPIKKIRPCPLSEPSCPLSDSYRSSPTLKSVPAKRAIN